MTNAVLFIYAADVLFNLAVLLQIFIFIGVIAVGVMTVAYYTTLGDAVDTKSIYHDECVIINNRLITTLKILIPSLIVSVSILVFIPSRNTLYTIGAVQAIEQFSTTPQAGVIGEITTDTLDLLRDKIKEMKNAK